jgi:hypothetical protein
MGESAMTPESIYLKLEIGGPGLLGLAFGALGMYLIYRLIALRLARRRSSARHDTDRLLSRTRAETQLGPETVVPRACSPPTRQEHLEKLE